jgi:hypothetical protein
MSAICASRPAGIDVKQPSRTRLRSCFRLFRGRGLLTAQFCCHREMLIACRNARKVAMAPASASAPIGEFAGIVFSAVRKSDQWLAVCRPMKVGAASRWPQTKRLLYPFRDDPAAERGPLQNVETAQPLAGSRQLETQRLRSRESRSEGLQIRREPISAASDASEIDREWLKVHIGKFLVSEIKHQE